MNYSNNLSTALSASLVAGDMIMEIYNSEDFVVELKHDNFPLTRADKASLKIIIDILSSLSLPILSEEDDIHPYRERKSWESFWMIDPLTYETVGAGIII